MTAPSNACHLERRRAAPQSREGPRRYFHLSGAPQARSRRAQSKQPPPSATRVKDPTLLRLRGELRVKDVGARDRHAVSACGRIRRGFRRI